MTTPAAFPLNHAHLVLKRLLRLNPGTGPARHHLILVGSKVESRDDTDRELPFRQESNFAYLTGCEVPGAAFTLTVHHQGGDDFDPELVETKLYLPAVNPDEVMWCGLPPTAASLAEKLSFTTIQTGWTALSLHPPPSPVRTYVHHLPWTPAPSKALVASINGPISSTQYLIKALHEARRNKTPYEIELMRKASEITGAAHTALMRAVGSGDVADENAAEALFVAECRKRGAKHQAYSPIMGAGRSAGTLHYVDNDASFPDAPGSLMLVDAGAEYKNYAADVTRCIPIGNGGRFTDECKAIYEIVLEMQEEGFKMVKPNAIWEDIQLRMHDIAARGLLKLGIFKAGSVKGSEDDVVAAIVKSGLTMAFYPHGVGHLLGLDVHDVGGLPKGKSTSSPLLRYLRLQQVPLEPGFVVTVEPGLYFNAFLFAEHKNSEFVDHDVLARYEYVGGVRIEDNLLITEDGFENLTPASLPKTVAEVEAVTAGAQ